MLMQTIQKDPDCQVRLEAIRAVGLVGEDAARGMLSELALRQEKLPVRVYAFQELARSFEEEAPETLKALLRDKHKHIRLSAVKALTRKPAPEALATPVGLFRGSAHYAGFTTSGGVSEQLGNLDVEKTVESEICI